LQAENDRLRRLAWAGRHRSVAARGLPVVVRWLAAVPELVLVGLAALAVFAALVRAVRRH
jgi:hypothetical protein